MIKKGVYFTVDTRDIKMHNEDLAELDVDETKATTVPKFTNFLDTVKSGNWIWGKNFQCKYVKVFLVGEECYLFNRDGEQITLQDLEFQHE